LEYGNPILRKYLADDQFSQHIYQRQSEINAAVKQFADQWIASALAERTPLKSLLRLLGLPLTRASLQSPPPSTEPATPTPSAHRGALGLRYAEANVSETGHATVRRTDAGPDARVDYFEVFKEIFSKIVQVSTEAGARFVFVNIPAYQTICEGVDHPWKRQVLDFVQSNGVDFIDLERDFRNADKTIGRDELFSVPPCGGHFSERGYKVIGDRLLQYLEMREALANSDGPVGMPDGWRVVTSQIRRDGPVATPRVLWSETQVYESYAKFSAVLAAGSEVPTRAEGASILGLPYKRHKGGNSLRITVKFTAYSLQDNEIVAALFVGDGSKSARVSSQPVTAGSSASVMLTYDIDELSNAPVNIEVRVGSRLPGELYINGNDTGPVTSDLKTSLTIEEIGIEKLSPTLIYVGSALSQSELLEGRRSLAAKMREPSLGVLARTFEDAKGWVVRKISTKKDFSYQQIYEARAHVDRVIGTDMVLDVEGASIMGYGWTPKSSVDLVRVKVVVPAWSNQPKSIVAALFVNQSVVANKVVSQELPPGKVAEAVLEFEMVPASTEPVALDVRVGPGQPGVIYLNGNENGPDPHMPKPTLTIEEYRPFWR
jgi:hypothetical protein